MNFTFAFLSTFSLILKIFNFLSFWNYNRLKFHSVRKGIGTNAGCFLKGLCHDIQLVSLQKAENSFVLM